MDKEAKYIYNENTDLGFAQYFAIITDIEEKGNYNINIVIKKTRD